MTAGEEIFQESRRTPVDRAVEGEGARVRPPPTEEIYNIRIARDGTWFHEGRPIRRPGLVKLFASVLRRDDAGDYWLVTPAERGRIVVEDAPFVAVAVEIEGERVVFRTNLDESVVLDADHPLRVETDPQTGEPRPYVLVRPGLEARLSRNVFYELVDRASPRPVADGIEEFGVVSCGRFFPLGRSDGT